MRPWILGLQQQPWDLGVYMMMIMVIEGELGSVSLGFFSISSLDFLFSKTSCFLPTLETLVQLNNYENNIFHNYYFWTVLQPIV